VYILTVAYISVNAWMFCW